MKLGLRRLAPDPGTAHVTRVYDLRETWKGIVVDQYRRDQLPQNFLDRKWVHQLWASPATYQAIDAFDRTKPREHKIRWSVRWPTPQDRYQDHMQFLYRWAMPTSTSNAIVTGVTA